jgi:polyhydroxybutyrate depolymerase
MRYEAAMLGALAAGCGSGSEAGATGGADASSVEGSTWSADAEVGGSVGDASALDAGAPADPGADASAPIVCAAPGLPAGDHDFMMQHAGKQRQYRVYVPASVDQHQAAPLVVNLHPLVLNGPGQEAFSNMDPAADRHRVIVAYPTGLNASWNGGACCRPSNQNMEDDVGFVVAMVAEIESKVCVDPKRVYATGHSNGAFLAHRLGCEAGGVVAAIAPASGTLGVPESDCNPPRPVPVLDFHGTADPLVPFDGGTGESVPATMGFWASRDGCTGPETRVYAKGAVHCDGHLQCAAGAQVILCTAEGGGHCWPGSSTCPVGAPITDIDGDEYMLSFFEAFRLP